MTVMKSILLALLCATSALAQTKAPTAAPINAKPTTAPTDMTTTMMAMPTYNATKAGMPIALSGKNDVPVGDLTANGTAILQLSSDKMHLCYSIKTNLKGISAGHIHKGVVGVAGDVVVLLNTTATTGPAPLTTVMTNCVMVAPALVKSLQVNATQYYVNFHTAAFPAGAERGQLISLQ